MPVRALAEVDRQPFAEATSADLRHYERTLDPFVLTGCTNVVSVWSTFAEDVCGLLRDKAPALCATGAEVTAMATERSDTVTQSESRSNVGGAAGVGWREAPRYYGGHHDIRMSHGVVLSMPIDEGDSGSHARGVSGTLPGRPVPAATTSPHGATTTLTDSAAPRLHRESTLPTDHANVRRVVYRWTGGVDILDDPQQVRRGLLEQRVQQLAATSTSPGAVRAAAVVEGSLSASGAYHDGEGARLHSRSVSAGDLSRTPAEQEVGASNTSTDDEGCECGEYGSDENDDVSSSSAAMRLPDRRPELTLDEALHVVSRRSPGLLGTVASVGQHTSSPTSPTDASFLSPNEDCEAPLPERIATELRHYQGSLYVKSPLSMCVEVCDTLELGRLLFVPPASVRNGASSASAAQATKVAVKSSPLGLQGTSYAAWLFIGEKGAGTRCHSNVGGSHGWHLLLRGTKKWRVAHPLDRHLVCSPTTGAVADLFQDSTLTKEAQLHTRVFEITQHAGEALFLPSEAIYTDLCLEDTVAIHVNFHDASTLWQERRFKRFYSLLLAPTNRDAMFPAAVPFTMVDLVLFADNVYPSFRGKNRTYRPNAEQDVLVVRGFAEFTQVRLPCSELGARVELEALQHCFGPIGKCLSERWQPARYAVGVPKGYVTCEKEHRLLLYYYVKASSLEDIKEALALPELRKAADTGRRPLQWFTRRRVTLPDVEYFRSTCSHQGLVPNYVPLSVLLAQSWPFEKDLCRYLVSLPRIILDKAYNQCGFIRPGSVWHYSRFDLDQSADRRDGNTFCADDDNGAQRKERSSSNAVTAPSSGTTHARTQPYLATSTSPHVESSFGGHRTLLHPGRANAPCGTDEEGGSCASPAPCADEGSSTTMPSSFARSFANVDAVEQQPGSGWCRTFLFYCSSLLDTPVAMHPVAGSEALQDSQNLLANGIRSQFHPRILEFVWNVNMLEEYGLVSLLQLETSHETAEAVIRRKIFRAPCFPQFEEFLELHGLHRLSHSREHTVEKVMAAVLWFTCTPCIVGFVSGTSSGAPRPSQEPVSDEIGGEAPNHTHGEAYFGAQAGPSSRPCVPFVDNDVEEARGKWDTVCLTATAASALLVCVPASPYATIVSRLSNWLCDEYEEVGEARQEQVLQLVQAAVNSHDVERQAVVFEVLRIKKQAYARQCACADAEANATTAATCAGSYDCREVNGEKLKLLERMLANFKLPASALPNLMPSL